MELLEIQERNRLLKELILSAADRNFWDATIAMTEESLAVMDGDTWQDVENAVIVGHGTSFATACNAESYLSRIAGLRARAVPAFEVRAYPDDYLRDPEKTAVIGISCSGNTVSMVKCLEEAKARGCRTVCISGEGDIAGGRTAEIRIITDCLVERRGAYRHPYSVSHLFLLLAAYKLAVKIGKANGHLDEGGAAYWNSQLEKALAALAFLPELDREIASLAAENLAAGASNHIVIGSGPNHGTMVEAALKISEFSWQLGAGEELEDFAHGRFREMDGVTPLMIICPEGPCVEKARDLLAGAAIAGSRTVVFTDSADKGIEKLARRVVRMPHLEEEYLTPFVYIFAFWLYGFHVRAGQDRLVGEARYGLYAKDINYAAQYDEAGNPK